MFFLIEYDKRQAVAKAATEEELTSFLSEHDLPLAFAVIGEEDDMAMEMSLKEMQDLHDNLAGQSPDGKRRTFEDEDEAASVSWELLKANAKAVPTISSKVRKALLKDGGGGIPPADAETPERPSKRRSKAPAAKGATTSGKRITAKQLRGRIFSPGDTAPKEGIDRHFLWLCLEENLGEASYEELVEFYIEAAEEKKGKEIKETEAHSKIVSALKKGNIAIANEEDDL